jgi:hypothetical protein
VKKRSWLCGGAFVAGEEIESIIILFTVSLDSGGSGEGVSTTSGGVFGRFKSC